MHEPEWKGEFRVIPKNEQREIHSSNSEKTYSSLPSRSEFHRKKKKSKIKIKLSLIKLLMLLFILLPIGFYCVYLYIQDRPVYHQTQ